MYKVQIAADRKEYRKQYFDGIYIPPEPPPPIPEMKRRCLAYMRHRLEASDPAFRECKIEISVFRKIRTDFVFDESSLHTCE